MFFCIHKAWLDSFFFSYQIFIASICNWTLNDVRIRGANSVHSWKPADARLTFQKLKLSLGIHRGLVLRLLQIPKSMDAQVLCIKWHGTLHTINPPYQQLVESEDVKPRVGRAKSIHLLKKNLHVSWLEQFKSMLFKVNSNINNIAVLLCMDINFKNFHFYFWKLIFQIFLILFLNVVFFLHSCYPYLYFLNYIKILIL